MMQVAILDVQRGSGDGLACLCSPCRAVGMSQAVSVPPQVTFMSLWMLLLPEPAMRCSYLNPCLLFDPIAGNLLLSAGEFLPSCLA